MKKQISMLMAVIMLSALIMGIGTLSAAADSTVLVPMNTTGKKSDGGGGFGDNNSVKYDTITDDGGDGHLGVILRPSTLSAQTGFRRVNQQMDTTVAKAFKTRDRAYKMVVKTKLRADSVGASVTNGDWINVALVPTIPGDNNWIRLAAVKVVSSTDSKQKVRLGDTYVIDQTFNAGEFIDFEITLNVPDRVGNDDVIPVTFKVNNNEYNDVNYSLTRSQLETILESKNTNVPRLLYIAKTKTLAATSTEWVWSDPNYEVPWSIDDSGIDLTYDYYYYKSVDFNEVSLDGDGKFVSPITLGSTGKGRHLFTDTEGTIGEEGKTYLASENGGQVYIDAKDVLKDMNRPIVIETKVYPTQEEKIVFRVEFRGGANTDGRGENISLLTFNSGNIYLRGRSSDHAGSVKIGEYALENWYDIKLIVNLNTEKMYAQVTGNDADIESVVDIPVSAMQVSQNTAANKITDWAHVRAVGFNTQKGPAYVSGLRYYTISSDEAFACETVQTEDPATKWGKVDILQANEVIDLTTVTPVVKLDGEETEYNIRLSDDGKTVSVAPKSGNWVPGEYLVDFTDVTVKDIYGREVALSGSDTFTVYSTVFDADVTYAKQGTGFEATGDAVVRYNLDGLQKADAYFAAFDQNDRLIVAKHSELSFTDKHADIDVTIENCASAEYVKLFIWSENMDMYTILDNVSASGL